MTRPERALLIHRLCDLADIHDCCRDRDDMADDAGAIALSMERGHALDAELLREAAAALDAAPAEIVAAHGERRT